MILIQEKTDQRIFYPTNIKNSKVILETDRPTPNNKAITPVISDSHSNKNSHGVKKPIRCGKVISDARAVCCLWLYIKAQPRCSSFYSDAKPDGVNDL